MATRRSARVRRLAAGATVALAMSCSAVGYSSEGYEAPVVPPLPESDGPVEGAAASTPEPFTMRFTGDMLVSDVLRDQAASYAGGQGFDFDPMLADVAPLISGADFSVCHQETPISDDNVGLNGYPSFNAPRELAQAQQEIGFDACSTASNHTVDLGVGGITATLDNLDDVGIAHTGSARTAAEHDEATIYDIKGVQVGHLSFTYGLNGQVAPTPWAVNVIDPAVVRADAAALCAAGADVVVTSLHFGNELDQTPSAYQDEVVDQVMGGPEVDLIIGHHAHVVQPAQQRPDGRWVVFGLGNFLAEMDVSVADPTPAHRDGAIIEATFAPDDEGEYAVSQMGYVPTFVDAPSDVVTVAPDFSRARTEAALTARGAELVDLTPR